MATRNKVFAYVKEKYGTLPDRPFEKSPDTVVLRHRSGKWYCLVMSVDKEKLNLRGRGKAEILNLKTDPDMIGTLRKEPGILPAYHMNKEHWISVVLGSPLPEEMLHELIDTSYILTASRKEKIKYGIE